jgi:hypothetical protein
MPIITALAVMPSKPRLFNGKRRQTDLAAGLQPFVNVRHGTALLFAGQRSVVIGPLDDLLANPRLNHPSTF